MSYTRDEERVLREWWHAVVSECDRTNVGMDPARILKEARWNREDTVTRLRGVVVVTFAEGFGAVPDTVKEWWDMSVSHQMAYSLGRRLGRSLGYPDRLDSRNRMFRLTTAAVAAEQSAVARMLAEE